MGNFSQLENFNPMNTIKTIFRQVLSISLKLIIFICTLLYIIWLFDLAIQVAPVTKPLNKTESSFLSDIQIHYNFDSVERDIYKSSSENYYDISITLKSKASKYTCKKWSKEIVEKFCQNKVWDIKKDDQQKIAVSFYPIRGCAYKFNWRLDFKKCIIVDTFMRQSQYYYIKNREDTLYKKRLFIINSDTCEEFY